MKRDSHSELKNLKLMHRNPAHLSHRISMSLYLSTFTKLTSKFQMIGILSWSGFGLEPFQLWNVSLWKKDKNVEGILLKICEKSNIISEKNVFLELKGKIRQKCSFKKISNQSLELYLSSISKYVKINVFYILRLCKLPI